MMWLNGSCASLLALGDHFESPIAQNLIVMSIS